MATTLYTVERLQTIDKEKFCEAMREAGKIMENAGQLAETDTVIAIDVVVNHLMNKFNEAVINGEELFVLNDGSINHYGEAFARIENSIA